MKKTINIIGAGRLGKTLGHLFVREDILQVSGVCNFSGESTKPFMTMKQKQRLKIFLQDLNKCHLFLSKK